MWLFEFCLNGFHFNDTKGFRDEDSLIFKLSQNFPFMIDEMCEVSSKSRFQKNSCSRKEARFTVALKGYFKPW